MIALIRKAAASVAKIAAAPFVSFGRGAAAGGVVTWLLHLALVAAAACGLWRLNGWLELEKVVRAPSNLLRDLWLPIMFLLAYAIAWAALATWRAATNPEAASEFPELDRCWRQALAAMRRHGVELTERRLILVLGEPAGREADLLSSFAVAPTFGPAPSQPDAKLRAFADERAVYLMCHEASLLSIASERLAHLRGAKQRVNRPFQVGAKREQEMPAPLRAAGVAAAQDSTINYSPSGSPPPLAPNVCGDADVATLGEQLATLEEASGRTTNLYDDEQAQRCAAELEHLVQLIKSERGPVAPIDGIAALTPIDAIDSDATAESVSWAFEQDLDVVGEAAGIRCPVLSVISDLQHAPGCGRLLHILPSDRKNRRLGVEMPPHTEAKPGGQAEAIGELTNQIASALCQRLMQVDTNGEAGLDSLRDNAALFELQSHLAERGERLAALLSGAVDANAQQGWPLQGCCLVATGDALGGGQAFGAGVLQQLTDGKSPATWTAAALARDARQTRLVNAGYAALAAACAGVAALLFV